MLKINIKKPKTIVILGFFRSATSLVAKGLSNEIYMGTEMWQPDYKNPKGYYENLKFLHLNNAILTAAGGDWLNPPEEKDILNQQDKFAAQIQSLLKEESINKDIWGWKHPVTTLTIPLYMPYLKNPHFVCCFRNPHEVAQSFVKFETIPISYEKARNLVTIYNQRLLNFIEKFVQ